VATSLWGRGRVPFGSEIANENCVCPQKLRAYLPQGAVSALANKGYRHRAIVRQDVDECMESKRSTGC
jgi:hypothetical protein